LLNGRPCVPAGIHRQACRPFLSSVQPRCSWRGSVLDFSKAEDRDMGKYFIAWLLGVPAGLLLLIYVFTHLF